MLLSHMLENVGFIVAAQAHSQMRMLSTEGTPASDYSCLTWPQLSLQRATARQACKGWPN